MVLSGSNHVGRNESLKKEALSSRYFHWRCICRPVASAEVLCSVTQKDSEKSSWPEIVFFSFFFFFSFSLPFFRNLWKDGEKLRPSS